MSIALVTKGMISGKIGAGSGTGQDIYVLSVGLDIGVPRLSVAMEVPTPPAVNVSISDPILVAVSVENPEINISADDDTVGVEV